MRRLVCVLAVVVVFAGLTAMAADPAKDGARPATSHQFRVDFDPTTGVIASPTEGIVNGDFTQISATCTNCPSACPPEAREIVVVLRAVNPVGADYFVGNMYGNNDTLTGLVGDRKDPLTPGAEVTYTFQVDVLDCGTHFGVWFDMCQPGNQGDPTAPCP